MSRNVTNSGMMSKRRIRCDGERCHRGPNAFLKKDFTKEESEVAMQYWHAVIRPQDGRLFRSCPVQGLTRDFLHEVETKLGERMRAEVEERAQLEEWKAAGFPYARYLSDFLRQWLGLQSSPRWDTTKREAVLSELRDQSWVARWEASEQPIDDLIAVLAKGLKSARQSKKLLSDTRSAAQLLEHKGLTPQLVLYALMREAEGKRGPAAQQLHFCTAEDFISYSRRMFQNTYRDWLRRKSRESQFEAAYKEWLRS